MKVKKTNALRILDQHKVKYEIFTYEYDENDVTGKKSMDERPLEVEAIFKTLVLKGERNGYLVCCVPTNEEIDLKKLAIAFKDKKVEMIAMKDLLSITGYIRGGCSPIGMKKKFPTFFHQSCLDFETIAISAGQRGMQVILKTIDLLKVVGGNVADVIKE